MSARDEIIDYAGSHPDASYADISTATGRSGPYVGKVLRAIETDEQTARRKASGRRNFVTPKRDMADIAGQRFGRLTAVERVGKSTWRCRCDCGAMVDVRMDGLRGGTMWRCSRGCPIDTGMVPGARFEHFELVGVARPSDNPRRNGDNVWLCRCECGNEFRATERSIRKGFVSSCGCVRRRKSLEAKGVVDGTSAALLNNKPNSNSSSGVKGVSWSKDKQRWVAHIRFKGRSYTLGRFGRLEDAADARRSAEEALFDPFLEEMGREPTSEEDFRKYLDAAIEKRRNDWG